MRIACVLVDHLPFQLETARDHQLTKHRTIIFERSGSKRRVLDVSPDIKQVTPGMPLQEALARCKDAALIEADIPQYEHAFNHILLRLGDWSPAVEAASLGCAYVGLDGLEDTYGNEQRLIDILLLSIPQRLSHRLGVANGKFPAYMAAMKATCGGAYKPPNNLRIFMAPFPVDVLPVHWGVKAQLHSFGLHTLGQIANLPLGPIQAQFGPTGTRLWQLARGTDDSPLIPRRHEEEFVEGFAFATPITSLEPMLIAIENLLSRLFAKPEMRCRFVRTALLKGHILGRPHWQRRLVFKSPVGDKSRAYCIIKGLLDNITLPGPLEDISLTFKNLTGEVGKQGGLFQEIRWKDQLRETISQLKVSQGHNPIYQMREVEPWSRIPERQRALVSYEP